MRASTLTPSSAYPTPNALSPLYGNVVGHLQNKCTMEMNGNGHIMPLKPGSNSSGVSSRPVLMTALLPGERHTLSRLRPVPWQS